MWDPEVIGRLLPAYEVGPELGRGGWGVVLSGRHRSLGRRVAIKVLPPRMADDPAVRERFVTEARLVAGLDHPHVVPIYDFAEDDGVCVLVMELLPRGSLWERFRTEGLAPEQSCAAVMAVCSALHYAHGRGILHRDIKPDNVLFSAQGTLKVTDFGLAKVLGLAAGTGRRPGSCSAPRPTSHPSRPGEPRWARRPTCTPWG